MSGSQKSEVRSQKSEVRSQIKRREDWPARLGEAIEEARVAGFVWGKNDCCLFAANAVRAMCGVDPAAGFRGYATARGAAARLKEYGGVAALAAIQARRFGWPEVAPATARRGDVVLVEDAGGEALGVVDLSGRWVLQPAAQGLAARPLARAGLRAWRIG
jgi:hypothetical protein